MSLLDVGKLALITVAPTLIGAVVVYAPRWWEALSEAWSGRRGEEPQPAGPPIEQLAADLRRLLRLHEELTRSAHVAMLATGCGRSRRRSARGRSRRRGPWTCRTASPRTSRS